MKGIVLKTVALIATVLLCAVNSHAQTTQRAPTPDKETINEYFMRGDIAELKDNILRAAQGR
jgi:hypothetical protein